jgi:hypothetical protein
VTSFKLQRFASIFRVKGQDEQASTKQAFTLEAARFFQNFDKPLALFTAQKNRVMKASELSNCFISQPNYIVACLKPANSR